MKIFTNIVLTAIAIVLAINILSTRVDKQDVDNIKHTFAIEKAEEFANSLETYTLVPKRIGLDTVKVQAQSYEQVIKDKSVGKKRYSEHTEYWVFIVNNRVRYCCSMDDYEIKK